MEGRGKVALWRAVLPRPPLCGGEMFAVIATECDVKVSDPLQTDRAPIVNLCIQKKVSANRARGPDQNKKAPTVARACLWPLSPIVLSSFTLLFNCTKTYNQKNLVLEISRGG